jgi:hypothetical protein
MTTKARARVVGIAILAAISLAAAACNAGITIPNPTTSSALVTVQVRGGECVEGPCGTTVVLERDGRVHAAAKPPNDLGIVSPADLAVLEAAIDTTDFAALRSHPFTGQCPTTFDGQELVFEFGAPGGVQRIAGCEVEIDFGSPLFVAVGVALGPFLPLPIS